MSRRSLYVRKRLAVVGAGLGGLALALRMAHRSHDVTVFEKTDQVGGRNRHERVGDALFDGGPTLLMMLAPFRRLFADVGEDFDALLSPKLRDPTYRVFYRDGSRVEATTNVERMQEQLSRLSSKDADRFPAYLEELRALYEDSIPKFVERNYDLPSDFLAPTQIQTVLKHGLLGNLAKRVQRTFSDPRVQMLFMFQTMYLGLSPYDAPFVYATLAYMEFGEGIFYPQGGLPAISDKVAELAQRRGATIRLNSPVRSMTSNSVTLASGETHPFDAVAVNADLPYAKRALQGKHAKTWRSSCSAYVMYLDYRGKLPDLLHHNVFFGQDFKGNLDDLFRHKKLSADPAFYACLSNRSDPSRASDDSENLFILIPCPNLDMPFHEDHAKALETAAFKRLCHEAGFDPACIAAKKVRSPLDWQRELNLDRGAAFGLSHDLFQSAFMRPSNKERDGVVYVGASTVPGNGLPMVLISAELAEQRLLEGWA